MEIRLINELIKIMSQHTLKSLIFEYSEHTNDYCILDFIDKYIDKFEPEIDMLELEEALKYHERDECLDIILNKLI